MDCDGPFDWYINLDDRYGIVGLFAYGRFYSPGLYFGERIMMGLIFRKHIKIGEDYANL